MTTCSKIGNFITLVRSVPLAGRLLAISFLLYVSSAISFIFDNELNSIMHVLYQSHGEMPYVWFVRSRYDIMIAHHYIATNYIYDFQIYDAFVLISSFWSVLYIAMNLCVLYQRDVYARTGGYRKVLLTFLISGSGGLLAALAGAPPGKDLLDATDLLKLFPRLYLFVETLVFAAAVTWFLPEALFICVWWIARGRRFERTSNT